MKNLMAYDCCSYVIKNEKQNRNIKNFASLFVYQRKMQKIEWPFSATIDQPSICYNTVATKVEVTVKMFLFFNMHLPLYAWNSHQKASLFYLLPAQALFAQIMFHMLQEPVYT